MDTTLLELLTCTSSGLLAGALLTEALVLVPFWKIMNPEDFQRLHPRLSPLLFRFFAPITVLGTALPALSCIMQWAFSGPAVYLWTISAVCGASLIGFYFGFFRHANIRVAESGSGDELSVTMTRWATVHSLRTVIAVVGFVFSALALNAG